MFDEQEAKVLEIFNPGIVATINKLVEDNRRFAYYTSADTALKILKNRKLWFRNATVMNDFLEVTYGLDLILDAFESQTGSKFIDAVESVSPGTMKKVRELFQGWMNDWKFETYLACVSLHQESEDHIGRLSMWRAYGDTALVINNTPMLKGTNDLGVFSLPVQYLSQKDYSERLDGIANAIDCNRDFLALLGQENLIQNIHSMLFETAIATKHPGFKEEQEWRLYYRPNEQKSPVMDSQVEIVAGVPQLIYTLPLENDEQNGLVGADIHELLDQIIIGPTEYPYVREQAFKMVLSQTNVAELSSKVFTSDIPIRTG